MKVSQSCTDLILALGTNATQTNIQTILSDILIKDSGNDTYIISQEDVTDLNIDAIVDTLKGKDDSKALVILVDNANRNRLLARIKDVGAKEVYELTKQDPSIMKEEFKVILNRHSIALNNLNITKSADTADMQQVPLESVSLPFKYTPGAMAIGKDYEGYLKDETDTGINDPEKDNSKDDILYSTNSELDREIHTPQTAGAVVDTIKKSIEELDFEQLREDLKVNEVIRKLEKENSSYKSLKQTIEMIDTEINSILLNQTISQDERFEKIINLLKTRSEKRTFLENSEAGQFYHISDVLVEATRAKVDKVVKLVENKYASKELGDIYRDNVANIQKLNEEKFKTQVALNNIVLSLNKTLNVYDELKTELISKFAEEGLTKLEVFNANIRPDFGSGTSENVTEMVNEIIRKATKTEQDYTLVVKRVSDAMEEMFKLQKINEEIIKSTTFTNKILVANRVEETVTITNPMKSSLRLFVGASNVGKTATAHIMARIQARQTTACVVDLSQKSNLSRYTDVYNLSEIIKNGKAPEVDYAAIVQDEVTSSMVEVEKALEILVNKFKFVILLIEDNDKEAYDYFVDKALSVNFVVDDTINSIEKIKPLTENILLPNTAVKLIDMHTELTPLELCQMYKVDPTNCKIIKIPKMPEIRRAVREGRDPAMNEDVKIAFENLLK